MFNGKSYSYLLKKLFMFPHSLWGNKVSEQNQINHQINQGFSNFLYVSDMIKKGG